jgi:hypothetical protein
MPSRARIDWPRAVTALCIALALWAVVRLDGCALPVGTP